MDFLFHSINIDVRIMNYDDILFICRADGDESQKNIAYLKRQLEIPHNTLPFRQECSLFLYRISGQVRSRCLGRRPDIFYCNAAWRCFLLYPIT